MDMSVEMNRVEYAAEHLVGDEENSALFLEQEDSVEPVLATVVTTATTATTCITSAFG